MTKPAVSDFIDSITADNLDLGFEQLEVVAESTLAGSMLKDTKIRAELDIVIVAIRRDEGEMLFNPTGETMISGGDMLVAIGKPESLMRLKVLATTPPSSLSK